MSDSRAVLKSALIWLAGPSFLLAGPYDPPTNYYAAAEGLSGVDLEDALHNIIDNHTVVPYSWPPFQAVDQSPTNSNEVELIYSSGTRAKNDNGGSAGDWNREHLWPRSYGIFNDGGADNSDIFNLRPCDVQVNAERGSLFFDNTGQAIPLQFSAPGCSKDNNSWEPRDDEKGDIARACFYMHVRYDGSDSETNDLTLSDSPDRGASRFGTLETLLEWHRLDPVNERNRRRNQEVYENWQGNRNPFIDHPKFAEQLFLAQYPSRDSDSDGLPDFWEWAALSSDQFDARSDPDGDEFNMLLEYAFGGNPTVADSSAPYLTSIGGLPRFVYYRTIDPQGISYTIETTVDLENGPWLPVPVLNSLSQNAGPKRTRVFAQIPVTSDNQRFYRMKVTAADSQ
ncbi:MAG: endonuclease I family protein [Akkermansiaceae bacterium]